VGIKAQGTTTILKINYRNTRQVLRVASLIAADLLHAEDADEDGIPRLQPLSCGRDGPEPLVLRLPSLRDEARQIADLLAAAHQEGHAWGDMVVLCRHTRMLDDFASALRHRQLPCQVCKASLGFQPQDNRIQLMTMHASKGLEFAVVALPGVGQMPHQGEDEREEARLFYVAATRATHKLLITVSGDGSFGQRLAPLGLQSN
jgi:superfamily I DNA/RNA helicase